MPLRLNTCLRPMALHSALDTISSGSAARRRTYGTPRMADRTTAEPLGASMSSCSGSSVKRHTQQSGSPGGEKKPASGCRRRRTTSARARASSAQPSAAPPFMSPNRMSTTSNSIFSLLTMSPKEKEVRSDGEHIGMDGLLELAKSVSCARPGGACASA